MSADLSQCSDQDLAAFALASAIMARLYGFGHTLSPEQTRLQATLIAITFLGLGIPLGLALKQIAWEAVASRQASETIKNQFGDDARIADLQINFAAQPVVVTATVLTPRVVADAERNAGKRLIAALGQPVRLEIDQLRVGSGDADKSQVSAARNASVNLAPARLAEKLALAGGVGIEDVLIDADHRRAVVRAAPLGSADLASFRELETRIAASEPNWKVEIVPPLLALPPISFDREGELDAAGAEAAAVAGWAARRLGLPVTLSGGTPALRETTAKALGLPDESVTMRSGGAALTIEWSAPSAP